MNQGEFFAYVIDVLTELNIPYMITGSVASMAYGEPRLTIDMDIVADFPRKTVENFCAKYNHDFYVDAESIKTAIKEGGHFNIIHVPSGSKVDFYQVKKDTNAQGIFRRRHKEAFDEKRIAFFSSPEDVIINKLIFYKEGKSEKHLRDIKGMLRISGDKLNISYIDEKTKKLGLNQYWEELKNS